MQKCYFCESSRLRTSSSQRSVWYDNKTYRFTRCRDCHGFSLFPKLTDAQLLSLYSSDYVGDDAYESSNIEKVHNSKFALLGSYLRNLEGVEEKTFLDYGCGANPISFVYAKEQGLVPSGMELSKDVREIAMRNTGVEMFSRDEIMTGHKSFDFVFLGDVLEHLVDPIIELESLHGIMSRDSLVIAQGPLQGSRTFTHLLVRAFAWLTQSRPTIYPPYHVSLASSRSLRRLFAKAGYQVERLVTFEVDWPAPSYEDVKINFSLRGLILFLAKQVDKSISRMYKTYGSRYFIVCSKIDSGTVVLK
jgi:hypothetical protein